MNMTKTTKALTVILLLAVLLSLGCEHVHRDIGGVVYSDYGILNQGDVKNPAIQYKPNWYNIVIGAVFFELVIPPIYVFGYHMMQPVGPKSNIKGTGL